MPISSALPIPALPAVSKQARSRQPTPLTNFPAWPAYPASSPSSSKNSALPIFPVGPPAAQICAADFSHWWHRCHFPSLRPDHQYFSSSLRLRIVQQLACRGQRRRAGPSSAQPLPRGRQPRASQQGLSPRQASLRSAAWLRGAHCRARARPIAQSPKGPQGPQALRPQSPRPSGPSAPAPSAPAPQRPARARAGARARARVGIFIGRNRVEAGRRRAKSGRIGSSPAGKRVVDGGVTSGHEAPHVSPSVAAARQSPAAGLWAPASAPHGQSGGTPLKSYKCYCSSGRGRHY